jgi:hypothetical protein
MGNWKGGKLLKNFIKRFTKYLCRWQLSSPILALCIIYLPFNPTVKTIIANIIGACFLYPVDRLIFKSPIYSPLWEIQEDIKCVDCGQIAKGFRLVKTKNYDKTEDKNPQYRCEGCSKVKLEELKGKGVKV